MTVKRKADKPTKQQLPNIDDIINRGGRTTEDSKKTLQDDEEVRFTLRIPQKIVEKVDESRSQRVGNVSRNQWILEAISENLAS
jgi:predicted HicB family RNase H-like nuclease